MEPEPQTPAPAVVAVVVTCDPGPWFDQTLAALAAQDYPNLSVLILDAGSEVDPTPAVARVMPTAFVRRLGARTTFGKAANEVMSMVDGASHYLICHDDTALAPDGVRLLVEEAFRSNSGIVTPKYLQWNAPDHLLAVGATTDRVGVIRDLVEPGELDQEQHDVIREVLVAPGGVTLIRADLFSALDGYDDVVDQFGEDLNLSWRARIAGARISVEPRARVLHLQAMRRGERAGWQTPSARHLMADTAESNRVRTLVTCYRWFDLLWIFPLAVLWSGGEAITSVVQGHPGDGWKTVTSFARGFRRPAQLWRSRRAIQRHRGAGDGELRRLQVKGNARFRAFLRSRVDDVREGLPTAALRTGRIGRTGYEDPDEETLDQSAAAQAATAPLTRAWRVNLAIVAVLLVVLIFGTRDLLGHALPAIGQLPTTAGGWSELWRAWWSSWQPGGLGVAAPSSPSLGWLGLIGTALFGAVGTLQHIVVLGPLLVGPIGAYRAARPWGSPRARAVALVAYAVVPLPYDSLARGHWGGLVAYAGTPWLLGGLARLSGDVPFAATPAAAIRIRVVGVALIIAVLASVAPSYLVVVPIVGVALLAGSALVGRAIQGGRMLIISLAATLMAVVLLFPWSASVLGNGNATLGPAAGAAGRIGFGQILRFHTGPFATGWLGWALLVAAALPLFIGREWRLVWATRLWAVAVISFVAAWAGTRGWFPAVPVEVILSPAAAALAGSAALGVASFELDLPGYRFGWRQLAAGVAGMALAMASVPLLVASSGGHWHLPTADASSVLTFLPDPHAGDYRVLWVGASDALPLAGRQLHPGIAYGTSYDGVPDISDLWISADAGAAPQLASDLELVEGRLTTRLGHLLAPASIRYIVIPNNTAPAGAGGRSVKLPGALVTGLALQTDLQVVAVDPDYAVYQNAAWFAAHAVLPAAAIPAASLGADASRRPLQELDLTGAAPVLTGGHASSSTGRAPTGSTVFVSSSRSARWRLKVGGVSLAPTPAFGWAMYFAVPQAGPDAGGSAVAPAATLVYHPPFSARAEKVFEMLLWAAAFGAVIWDTRRRNRSASPESVDPTWFVPMTPVVAAPRRRRVPAAVARMEDQNDDEAWSDV